MPDAPEGATPTKPNPLRECSHPMCACKLGAMPQCSPRYSNPRQSLATPEATTGDADA